MEKPQRPVLLYDGECGLCNTLVRFMLKHDRRGVLMFAPLQGRTGREFLRRQKMDTEEFDSVVFIEDLACEQTAFMVRSAGALRALGELGGGCRRAARLLSFIPAPCGDVIYRLVARLRYRIFGRYRPRPLANPGWERRFLD